MVLPKQSKAAVLREFRAPLTIEEVPVPKEIEAGAILTKIECCSVCGTDVHLWQGELAVPVDLPVILGHEMVGRIIALGAAAERDSVGQPLRVGDRIVWTHTNCDSCFFCKVARQPTLCTARRAYMFETMQKPPYLMGGFSEYGYVLPSSGRILVPESVSNELASLSSCAFRSVMNAFTELGAIATTDHVVIQGAGPLGLLAAAVAKTAGAKRVVVIGAPDARLALAGAFGADEIISIERTSPAERLEQVRSLTAGRGADIVMEFTGHPAAFNEGLDFARRGGRYVVIGQLGEGRTTIKPSTIVVKNLHIMGSFSGEAMGYWKALDFVAEHQSRIPLDRLITNRFPLAEVNVALERMRDYKEIKPAITLS